MRTPIGPEAMTKVVRFRLTEDDLNKLQALAEDNGGFSVVLRALIVKAYRAKKRRDARK
jgi:hypothetical protein